MKSIVLIASLLAASASAEPRTLTVAPDSSGDFTTVQAAFDAVPDNNADPIVIHVKPGTYKEKLRLVRAKSHVTLRGDDAQSTILTNDWNANHIGPDGKPVGTSGSYTVEIDAPDFCAENLTFENTAGDTGQALALSARGDRQVYRNCRLLGWQDTLYADGGRQYYDRCHIEGRVDFIFGSATAVFDHCYIVSKNGGHVTAASTPQEKPWGYVFLDCTLASTDGVPADLGRPWRDYASVTFVRCDLGRHVKPEGWSNWKGTERDKTARYAEYHCTGPGADRSKRVPWAKELTDEQAKDLTVETLLGGTDHWNPKASKP